MEPDRCGEKGDKTAMDQKSQETITKYLGDMHALLDHGQQPLARQVDQIRGLGHPEALRLVEEID